MNIVEALSHAQNYTRVRRSSWRYGLVVVYVPAAIATEGQLEGEPIGPFLVLQDGRVVSGPWVPTLDDLLARNWEVVT